MIPTNEKPGRITESKFRDLVDEIYPIDEEEIPAHLKVRKYKEIYELSKRAFIEKTEKDFWKEKYLKCVLDYGFQLKRDWSNAGLLAIKKFESVIWLGRNVPIANYRLGHIFFKQKNYHNAVINFELALMNNKSCEKNTFRLEAFQESVAKKFVAYCCLRLFEEYKEISLKDEKYSELVEQIEKYLYLEKDLENLDLLVVRIFKEGKMDQVRLMKEDDYLDLKDKIEFDKNSMCLDGYQSQRYIGYFGKGKDFSQSFILLKNILTGKVIC